MHWIKHHAIKMQTYFLDALGYIRLIRVLLRNVSCFMKLKEKELARFTWPEVYPFCIGPTIILFSYLRRKNTALGVEAELEGHLVQYFVRVLIPSYWFTKVITASSRERKCSFIGYPYLLYIQYRLQTLFLPNWIKFVSKIYYKLSYFFLQ